MFAGNVAESTTLEDMLKGLTAPKGALVIMDAGIATAANIAWLKKQEYHYLVVSRERGRQFDPDQAVDTLTASNETIQLQRVLNADGTEVRLYCHSTGRDTKETAISGRFVTRFETGLAKLAAGLDKPRAQKKLADIQQRIGRLKEKSRGIGQHYEITVTPDETGKKAAFIAWTKTPVDGSMLTHPGVCCLRSNETTWDAAKLWHTYTMLTDLAAVFRGLKSELGLRPVFHHNEKTHRGAPVHHRAGLSIGPGHPAQTGGRRGDHLMVPSARDPVGATTADGDVPSARRPHSPCPQDNPRRARVAQDLRRFGHRRRAGRGQETHRVNPHMTWM